MSNPKFVKVTPVTGGEVLVNLDRVDKIDRKWDKHEQEFFARLWSGKDYIETVTPFDKLERAIAGQPGADRSVCRRCGEVPDEWGSRFACKKCTTEEEITEVNDGS